jgi:hypothetical protein
MINFDKCFFVSKKEGLTRKCGILLCFNSKFQILTDLNNCDYSYSKIVIDGIGQVLSNQTNEYEWGGGERAWFSVQKEITIIRDNFGWIQDIELPTITIFQIMKSRMHLMEDFKKNYILEIISSSFKTIKRDSSIYAQDEIGSMFKVRYDEKNISVVLFFQESDFALTTQEYLNEIQFNNKFFAESFCHDIE